VHEIIDIASQACVMLDEQNDNSAQMLLGLEQLLQRVRADFYGSHSRMEFISKQIPSQSSSL